MTSNITVLDIWILRVRNMSTSIIEVCRHDMGSMFALLLAENKINTKQENKTSNRGLCDVLDRKSNNEFYRYIGLTNTPIQLSVSCKILTLRNHMLNT